MSKLLVLGASGSLGQHVARLAVDAGHEVSVVVRTPSKLPAAWRDKVRVHEADLMNLPARELAALAAAHDAVINTAGLVTEGERFVALVDHIVTSLETLPLDQRPVAWFLGGLGVLEIGNTGHRGVDLPGIRKTYWPHGKNFQRLQASSLDFRMLCPGPMVQGEPIGVARLRATIDRLPVPVPPSARFAPKTALVPLVALKMPEMIIKYADAAAFMLGHLHKDDPLSRHRIGLALPVGMRGKKERWRARAPADK